MPTEDDRFQIQFRGVLQDIASRVKPPGAVPVGAVRRARVKLWRNVMAAVLAVALLAVGGVRGIELFSIMHSAPKPGSISTVSPTTQIGSTLTPLRVPTAAEPLRVLVVGDSFSQDIVDQGLAPATSSTFFRLIDEGIQSTGLSRPDYFNWPSALAGFMQQYHPDIVIIMLGGNDPQPIHTSSGGTIGVGDPRWPTTYRERVDQMMNLASQNGTHVMWIGMPIMGLSAAYSRNIESLNSIYAAEAAKRPNVLYLDTWDLFAKKGKYSDSLPDQHGHPQLVRSSDKVHLSAAGNRILSSAVIAVMKEHAGWNLSPKALG